MAGTAGQFTKPMNVKEIVEKAQAFDFNPHIPCKYWLRTADTLLREVLFT
jgi:STAM-binding protein